MSTMKRKKPKKQTKRNKTSGKKRTREDRNDEEDQEDNLMSLEETEMSSDSDDSSDDDENEGEDDEDLSKPLDTGRAVKKRKVEDGDDDIVTVEEKDGTRRRKKKKKKNGRKKSSNKGLGTTFLGKNSTSFKRGGFGGNLFSSGGFSMVRNVFKSVVSRVDNKNQALRSTEQKHAASKMRNAFLAKRSFIQAWHLSGVVALVLNVKSYPRGPKAKGRPKKYYTVLILDLERAKKFIKEKKVASKIISLNIFDENNDETNNEPNEYETTIRMPHCNLGVKPPILYQDVSKIGLGSQSPKDLRPGMILSVSIDAERAVLGIGKIAILERMYYSKYTRKEEVSTNNGQLVNQQQMLMQNNEISNSIQISSNRPKSGFSMKMQNMVEFHPETDESVQDYLFRKLSYIGARVMTDVSLDPIDNAKKRSPLYYLFSYHLKSWLENTAYNDYPERCISCFDLVGTLTKEKKILLLKFAAHLFEYENPVMQDMARYITAECSAFGENHEGGITNSLGYFGVYNKNDLSGLLENIAPQNWTDDEGRQAFPNIIFVGSQKKSDRVSASNKEDLGYHSIESENDLQKLSNQQKLSHSLDLSANIILPDMKSFLVNWNFGIPLHPEIAIIGLMMKSNKYMNEIRTCKNAKMAIDKGKKFVKDILNGTRKLELNANVPNLINSFYKVNNNNSLGEKLKDVDKSHKTPKPGSIFNITEWTGNASQLVRDVVAGKAGFYMWGFDQRCETTKMIKILAKDGDNDPWIRKPEDANIKELTNSLLGNHKFFSQICYHIFIVYKEDENEEDDDDDDEEEEEEEDEDEDDEDEETKMVDETE